MPEYCGNSPINRSSYVTANTPPMTYMDRTGAVINAGNLVGGSVYFDNDGGGTYKVQVFRSNGLYWDLIGTSESFDMVGAGLRTFSLASPIAVLAGDFIAIQMSGTSADHIDADATGGSHSYIVSEITGNTLKALWTNTTWVISLQGDITVAGGGSPKGSMMMMGIGS